MFADTKIYLPIHDGTSHQIIQNDLQSLTDWAKTWQLRFNASKCKTLHLGNRNPQHTYEMEDQNGKKLKLDSTELEKDLGVNIDPSLKFSKHIEGQVNKANKMLGLIRRSYEYLDGDSFKRLFTALVRPHLEYCNVAWAPRLEKDKNLIEGVLRRGSKLVPDVKHLSYEERLEKLKIPSMTFRRARGDIIEAYKYTHELYDTDQILQRDTDTTRRGHSYKLKKRYCKSATRSNFFTYRVVDMWNKLPEEVVTAPSLNSLKSRFDKQYSSSMFKSKLPSPLPQANLVILEEEETAENSIQADA
jgi:hypothetical protein